MAIVTVSDRGDNTLYKVHNLVQSNLCLGHLDSISFDLSIMCSQRDGVIRKGDKKGSGQMERVLSKRGRVLRGLELSRMGYHQDK